MGHPQVGEVLDARLHVVNPLGSKEILESALCMGGGRDVVSCLYEIAFLPAPILIAFFPTFGFLEDLCDVRHASPGIVNPSYSSLGR